nr:translocation protein SEC62-like [Tanacetum cinerariifolium]
EQEFFDTDAFFAWTFVNKRPLWQTLLSLSWHVDSCNLLIPCVSPPGKTANSLLMCWGTPTYTLSALG